MKNELDNIFPVVLGGSCLYNGESLLKRKEKKKAVASALLTTVSGQPCSDKIEHKMMLRVVIKLVVMIAWTLMKCCASLQLTSYRR